MAVSLAESPGERTKDDWTEPAHLFGHGLAVPGRSRRAEWLTECLHGAGKNAGKLLRIQSRAIAGQNAASGACGIVGIHLANYGR